MTKKTHFLSKTALTSKTPVWAKNMFRTCLLLTSVASFIVVSDDAIPSDTAERIILYLRGLDLLVYGLSKTFGVTIEKEE